MRQPDHQEKKVEEIFELIKQDHWHKRQNVVFLVSHYVPIVVARSAVTIEVELALISLDLLKTQTRFQPLTEIKGGFTLENKKIRV